jgi:CBS domain-containing protein
MLAKDLMTSPVLTIQEDATVGDAARLMLDHDVSALPVMNDSGKMVGILTHSDFGLSPKFRPLMENVYTLLGATTTPQHLEATAHQVGGKLVKDVMRRNVITVQQDVGIEQISRLMMRSHIHRLPVMDGANLVGIITRHDFLKLITERQ